MLNLLRPLLPQNARQYREETAQRISWGHWFALFNIVLALLIASRYAFEADWPNTLFGRLYFFISLFGHFSFIVFAIYLLLLFPLSFLIHNNRAFRAISVVLASCGLTFLLVDTEVFKRFYLHLSPLVWDLLINPEQGELSRQWQLLFVPMPLILLAEMVYSRWCWQKLRSFNRQRWGKFVALFFVSCFTLTHLIYAWADMAAYRPVTAQKANYPISYPMTARSFLEKHGLIDKEEFNQQTLETGRLDTFFLDYPRKPLRISPVKTPINLVIINLTELSNEAISAETMPNLWQISQQSQRFMQHYVAGDSAGANIAGLFYGLSGKYLDAILNEKASSPLMSTLKQAGYQFGLFSYNGFEEPLYHRALFAGFSLPKTKNNLETVASWRNWFEKRKNAPFFSYVELTLPPANNAEQRAKLLDWQIDQIWQPLATQDALRNTLVIITASSASQAHQDNRFSRARTNVPMLVYWQGQSQRYNSLSSHLDILPTLLKQFFGVQNPAQDFAQGIDLTEKTERLWLLASDYKWNVAIMPNGEQYQIDTKGHFEYYNANGEQQKSTRPPLPLFLQLIQQSNRFIDK